MSLDEILGTISALSVILNLVLGFFLKSVWNKFKKTEEAVEQAKEDIHSLKSRQDIMEATYPTKEDLNKGLKDLSKDIHECIRQYSQKGDEEDRRLSESINKLNENVSGLMAKLERGGDEGKH